MLAADSEQIEALIEQLDGVISAKLTTDDDGEPVEIHVLAGRNKSPKQLSRDIQSAIAAATGKTIEHRIVSIAQISRDPVRPAGRLVIENLEISKRLNVVTASVTLRRDERPVTGTASCANASFGHFTAVASACINAVNSLLLGEPYSFADIRKVRIANMDEINIAICQYFGGMNRFLTGTALVYGDENEAVLRAALDAINRTLDRMPENPAP